MTDPTKPDDTRELQPVWLLHSRRVGDTGWRLVLSRSPFTDQQFAEHIALSEMNEWPGLEFRAVKYVPDDQSAVLRGKLETLEGAIQGLRLVSGNIEVYRADLVPGIALACVKLERTADTLRAQLAAVERDGKAGGNDAD